MHPRREPRSGSTGPDLLVVLAEDGKGTLRRRLRESVRGAIRDGRLPPGSRLPSSRALAADLGVSRGVVVDAYAQLCAEGFLISRPGSGTIVADTGAHNPARGARPRIATPATRSTNLEIDLRPGPPDLSTFPRGAWAMAGRDVLRTIADADLGYTPPWGVDLLREQLSEYLARVRGVMTDPSHIVVVTGATQGITLLSRVLHARGVIDTPSRRRATPSSARCWLGMEFGCGTSRSIRTGSSSKRWPAHPVGLSSSRPDTSFPAGW